MTTTVEQASSESIARAARIIRRGGLVAFPTETVYGLGANGLDAAAAARIFAAKGRPADNPLILHIARAEDVSCLAADISPDAQRLMDAFWPGALTLVLPKRAHIPDEVTGGLDTVGVRMPAHPMARDLILAAGLPIAAPSANVSGRTSPTLAAHVAHDLNGKIDMILDGGAAGWGLESTVVEVTSGGSVCVLRPGAVTLEQLRGVVPNVTLDPAVANAATIADKPKAPGMKYRHYAPDATLILVIGEPADVTEYILAETAGAVEPTGVLAGAQTLSVYKSAGLIALSLGDAAHPEDAAANLFRHLRAFDLRGIRRVYAEGVEERGIGLAVMNRLKKAAAVVVTR